MSEGNGNGWRFGWGALGTLAAVAIVIASVFSFVAGSTSSAAVLENRVTNLERRQGELVEALGQTNRKLDDLVTLLWQERADRRRAKGQED